VLQAGSRIAGYEIVGILGRGRAAYTYRARRLEDGLEVALKVPHSTSLGDFTFVTRFLREGTLGTTLNHRSIVRVLEAGEEERQLYLAMELVEGTTLSFELAGRKAMPLLRALNYAREVADALAHAHANGVVHRNLKPNHIMLLRGGRVKVMDLGVARAYGDVALTSPDVFLGTPTYSPPEAVDPRSLDPRSDVYSLGIIVFEMLQGHPPFEAPSAIELLIMQREKPFPAQEELAVEMPQPVWALAERMCRKRPEERYQSAAEVVEAVDSIFETLSSTPKEEE
jgi:serine/threonine protein kinase